MIVINERLSDSFGLKFWLFPVKKYKIVYKNKRRD